MDTNKVMFRSDITNDEKVKVETTASRWSKGGEKVLDEIFMSPTAKAA